VGICIELITSDVRPKGMSICKDDAYSRLPRPFLWRLTRRDEADGGMGRLPSRPRREAWKPTRMFPGSIPDDAIGGSSND
jgi:hypothetical protein